MLSISKHQGFKRIKNLSILERHMLSLLDSKCISHAHLILYVDLDKLDLFVLNK